jgi:short-subunit dehydrogenase
VDGWVDAAAVLIAGRLEDTPVDELERLTTTNVVGTMLASRAALQRFEAQGHGVLVNVSSVLGVLPNPAVPAYTMSKFAVRGLSLALRLAAAGNDDIHVCTVLPGPVDTPMFDRAANHTGRRLRAIPPACAPERAAAAIVRALRRPKRQVIVGMSGKAIVAAHHLFPRAVEYAVGRASARLLTRPEAALPSSGGLFAWPGTARVDGPWRVSAWRRRPGASVGRLGAERPAPRFRSPTGTATHGLAREGSGS